MSSLFNMTQQPPNMRFQRTRCAPLRSPLKRRPLGGKAAGGMSRIADRYGDATHQKGEYDPPHEDEGEQP